MLAVLERRETERQEDNAKASDIYRRLAHKLAASGKLSKAEERDYIASVDSLGITNDEAEADINAIRRAKIESEAIAKIDTAAMRKRAEELAREIDNHHTKINGMRAEHKRLGVQQQAVSLRGIELKQLRRSHPRVFGD